MSEIIGKIIINPFLRYKESIMQVTKQQIQDIANQMQIHTIYFLRN